MAEVALKSTIITNDGKKKIVHNKQREHTEVVSIKCNQKRINHAQKPQKTLPKIPQFSPDFLVWKF